MGKEFNLNNGELNVNFAGLYLRNPTILASGIMGYSRASFQRIFNGGAGAIVTKSIGIEPRTGYSNPTIVQTSCGLINAMGLPNPGIENYVNEISETKKALEIPLIVSIYGFSVEDYLKTSIKAEKAGADALELNVSCPHVKKTGSEIGQNPEILFELIETIKSKVKIPILIKLTPNITDIVEIAQVAVDAGVDAITATNTIKAIAIDVETTKPILSNIFGGLSGPSIKPIILRYVYELYEKLDIPIIGCGGINNWQDAVEFFLAGASAIQIGSAVATVNPSIFEKISNGITNYLKKKRIRSVNDIVGLSHKK